MSRYFQTMTDAEAPSLADYYTEFAARQKARSDAEQAAYLAYRAAQDRLPVSRRDTIDPSANGCGQRLNPYQFNALREF